MNVFLFPFCLAVVRDPGWPDVLRLFVLTVAGAFVALSLLLSFIRFHLFIKSDAAASAAKREDHDLLVPVARRLARLSAAPPFAVLLFEPFHLQEFADKHGAQSASQMAQHFFDCIRGCVRATDTAVLISGHRVGLVVDAPPENIRAVVERIMLALARHPFVNTHGVSCPLHGHAGVTLYPSGARSADALIQQVHKNLEQARTGAMNTWVCDHELPAPAGPKGSLYGSDIVADETAVNEIAPQGASLRAATQKFVAEARKNEEHAVIMLVSIDELWKYADHYSSDAVPFLLDRLFSFIRGHLREDDFMGWHDRETLVIGLFCDIEGGRQVARRLLQALRKTPFLFNRQALRVALHIGLAGYPLHARLPRDVIAAAVRAHQAAGDAGPNTYLEYDPKMNPMRNENEQQDFF